jgi:SAM-dependent methyltransferase
MPDPFDIAARDTFDFVVSALPARSLRVLDVGCGPGHLAAQLASCAPRVVAVDISPGAVEQARGRGVDAIQADWLAFDDAPFDVIVLARSLHHMDRMEDAVSHAARLSTPGGRVLVDELAVEAPDLATCEWLRTVTVLLHQAGAIQAGPQSLLARLLSTGDPSAAWRDHHEAHAPVHTAAAMAAALGRHLTLLATEEVPYLYRHFTRALPCDERGGALFRAIQDAEKRAISAGMIKAVGRHFILSRPTA